VALAIVASIAGAAHAVTGMMVDSRSSNASLVTVSGQQRMLSQRIALLASSWARTGDATDRRDLVDAIDLFSTSHDALLSGDSSLGLPSELPAQALNVYTGSPHNLDARVQEFAGAARAVADSDAPSPAQVAAVQQLARGGLEAPSLLASLDAAVRAFEDHHVAQISKLKSLQSAALAVLIAVLLLEAVLIVRPLIQRVRELTTALNDAAIIDPLTRARNRRGFDHVATVLAKQRQRGALVSFDIDHFKKVNDEHGHAVSDAVLARVARAAQEVLREGDALGRIGGEEFAAMLPGADQDAAFEIAERIRRAVERSAWRSAESSTERLRVTVSAGVCWFGDDARPTLDALLQHADQALYEAKAAGRNQVATTEYRGENQGGTTIRLAAAVA